MTAVAPVPPRRDTEPDAPGVYVGLVTRVIAFALDAAVINVVAILVSVAIALFFSVLPLPHQLRAVAIAIGGVVYVLWTAAYFVTFWSTTGQTPGSRIMRIRVAPTRGDRLPPRRALVRFAGLVIAALPLFAGYLLILVDDRRRGLQDRLARTVVVEADPEKSRFIKRSRPPTPR